MAADHRDRRATTLRQQQGQGGGGPLAELGVGFVAGQVGQLVDHHDDGRLVDGRGMDPDHGPGGVRPGAIMSQAACSSSSTMSWGR